MSNLYTFYGKDDPLAREKSDAIWEMYEERLAHSAYWVDDDPKGPGWYLNFKGGDSTPVDEALTPAELKAALAPIMRPHLHKDIADFSHGIIHRGWEYTDPHTQLTNVVGLHDLLAFEEIKTYAAAHDRERYSFTTKDGRTISVRHPSEYQDEINFVAPRIAGVYANRDSLQKLNATDDLPADWQDTAKYWTPVTLNEATLAPIAPLLPLVPTIYQRP